MAINFYTVIAVILAFTLTTTLRFSVAGSLKSKNVIVRAIANPVWFYPLILAGPFVLGAFYHGTISPWPPAAFAQAAQRAGFWAGAASAIGAMIADIWLLWATATTFRVFAPPHDKRMIMLYYAANLAVGLYLMARFLHVIHIGAPGISG